MVSLRWGAKGTLFFSNKTNSIVVIDHALNPFILVVALRMVSSIPVRSCQMMLSQPHETPEGSRMKGSSKVCQATRAFFFVQWGKRQDYTPRIPVATRMILHFVRRLGGGSHTKLYHEDVKNPQKSEKFNWARLGLVPAVPCSL